MHGKVKLGLVWSVISFKRLIAHVCLILEFLMKMHKGLGSRRGEIGPAIEMYTDLKYVYMVYFIEKNRNFICLVLKL